MKHFNNVILSNFDYISLSKLLVIQLLVIMKRFTFLNICISYYYLFISITYVIVSKYFNFIRSTLYLHLNNQSLAIIYLRRVAILHPMTIIKHTP